MASFHAGFFSDIFAAFHADTPSLIPAAEAVFRRRFRP